MDRMPLIAIIFQSIPESIIIFYLGLAGINIKPKFHKVLPAAILSSLVSWLVRGFPLLFSIHTLIGLFVFFCLFIIILRVPPLKAIVASLFAFSSLLGTEAILFPIITGFVNMANIQEAWESPVLRIILAMPELILLAAITYFLIRNRISFESFAYGDSRQKKEHFDK